MSTIEICMSQILLHFKPVKKFLLKFFDKVDVSTCTCIVYNFMQT